MASASDLPDTEFITQNMAAAASDAEALAAFTENNLATGRATMTDNKSPS